MFLWNERGIADSHGLSIGRPVLRLCPVGKFGGALSELEAGAIGISGYR